jgi:acylphosphatase
MPLKKRGDHGITGWVRNIPDGRVEGIFEGENSRIQEMLAFCQRGPPYARVDRVEAIEEPFRDEFREFEIRY